MKIIDKKGILFQHLSGILRCAFQRVSGTLRCAFQRVSGTLRCAFQREFDSTFFLEIIR